MKHETKLLSNESMHSAGNFNIKRKKNYVFTGAD